MEFAAASCIAVSFWALAVLVHIKLQDGIIKPLVLGGILVCCMLLLGFVSFRHWKSMGTPAILLLSAIGSYLFIGSAISLLNGIDLGIGDVLRQAFFLIITLAAVLGGRSMLERIGVEALLKWMLVVLLISCAVILASPMLRSIGVLPEYRIPTRLTGVFSDPNDAGLVACMTVALALTFMYNGTHRWLGHAALLLATVTVFSTLSFTAIGTMSVLSGIYLILNVRRHGRMGIISHTLIALVLVTSVLYIDVTLLRVSQPFIDRLSSFGDSPDAAPLIEGQPVYYGETGVYGGYAIERHVGSVISVGLVHDEAHRDDDIPIRPWVWQHSDDPSEDTDWESIKLLESGGNNFVPADEHVDRFLRAYTYYEKEGKNYLALTDAIGPILPSDTQAPPMPVDTNAPLVRSNKPLADMDEPLDVETIPSGPNPLVRNFRETLADARAEKDIVDATSINRTALWLNGIVKIREAPVFGHGFREFHYMEGNPIAYHGRPVGVHNLYLVLIGEAGIVPLALYLLTLFLLIWMYWKMPSSHLKDFVAAWVVVMALFGITFQHLLSQGTFNFFIGLTCAAGAFMYQHRCDENGDVKQESEAA